MIHTYLTHTEKLQLERRIIAAGFCHNFEERKDLSTTKFFKAKINYAQLAKAMNVKSRSSFYIKLKRPRITKNFAKQLNNFLDKFEAEKKDKNNA